jgi:hypothetical protein
VHQDLLFVIAQVAITLAGFSGVVFAIGRRSQGRISRAEKNGLFHLLFSSCGNVLVVLFMAALLEYARDDSSAWRIGSLAIGLLVLAGGLRALVEQRRGEHSFPKVLAWPVPLIALVLAGTNLAVAAGLFSAYAPALFFALSIYVIFVSILHFTSLLVPETTRNVDDDA